MSEQADTQAHPPELILQIEKARDEDLVDLAMIDAGAADAEKDICRQAALQLAHNLYPVSFFAMLARLKLLRAAIAKAQSAGALQAMVVGLDEAVAPNRVFSTVSESLAADASVRAP